MCPECSNAGADPAVPAAPTKLPLEATVPSGDASTWCLEMKAQIKRVPVAA